MLGQCRKTSFKKVPPLFVEKHLADRHLADRHLAHRHLANRHLAIRHLADRHLAIRHLADRHLADRHLADRHLAVRHLADRHLADRYLADRHLTDRHLSYRYLVDTPSSKKGCQPYDEVIYVSTKIWFGQMSVGEIVLDQMVCNLQMCGRVQSIAICYPFHKHFMRVTVSHSKIS